MREEGKWSLRLVHSQSQKPPKWQNQASKSDRTLVDRYFLHLGDEGAVDRRTDEHNLKKDDGNAKNTTNTEEIHEVIYTDLLF